jgi:hypothetical protein
MSEQTARRAVWVRRLRLSRGGNRVVGHHTLEIGDRHHSPRTSIGRFQTRADMKRVALSADDGDAMSAAVWYRRSVPPAEDRRNAQRRFSPKPSFSPRSGHKRAPLHRTTLILQSPRVAPEPWRLLAASDLTGSDTYSSCNEKR